MKIFSIETGLFKLDGGAMFGVVPKSIWQKQYPADENNMCTWAMRCMLIEDQDRLVLIDTGIGNKHSEKFLSHYYLHGDHTLENSIKKAGYELSDVTDVIFTHLHFDHCGGAIKKENGTLKLTFPNASYWTNQEHWNEATINPNPREKSSFFNENYIPIEQAGKLKFIDVTEETTFSKNIKIKFAYGHTKALMVPHIQYGSQEIIYCADLIAVMGHIPLAYVPSYDVQPLISMKEKEIFLNRALKNNSILFFEHDANIECCSLQQTERGIKDKETFTLKSIL